MIPKEEHGLLKGAAFTIATLTFLVSLGLTLALMTMPSSTASVSSGISPSCSANGRMSTCQLSPVAAAVSSLLLSAGLAPAVESSAGLAPQ